MIITLALGIVLGLIIWNYLPHIMAFLYLTIKSVLFREAVKLIILLFFVLIMVSLTQ